MYCLVQERILRQQTDDKIITCLFKGTHTSKKMTVGIALIYAPRVALRLIPLPGEAPGFAGASPRRITW